MITLAIQWKTKQNKIEMFCLYLHVHIKESRYNPITCFPSVFVLLKFRGIAWKQPIQDQGCQYSWIIRPNRH